MELWLTIEHVHCDTLGLRIGRVALVPPRVRGPCFLYQQEAGSSLPLLRDNAHTASRRVVADYLQQEHVQT